MINTLLQIPCTPIELLNRITLQPVIQIVHRDVKLENILLDASNRIKLIDFGLAANTMPGKKLKVHCGSPSYAAPEIVARRLYDGPPVDVWSLGIVLYGMICGHLPFHASDNKKVRHGLSPAPFVAVVTRST